MKKLFKKLSKKETVAAVQSLSKSQLEKVVGGADDTTTIISTEIYSGESRSINDGKKSTLSIIR